MKFENKNLKEFYRLEVQNLSKNTQKSKIYSIRKFLKIVNNGSIENLSKKHILRYIESDYFTNLSNSSKNLRLIHIKHFLKFHNKKDLADLFPKYKEKNKEINKNELISRDDLEKILKSAGDLRNKLLVMLLYESAIRKVELMSIRKKDFKFFDNYCNLYVSESKTKDRNIPLVETIPYLKEYFNKMNFKETDLIFDYDPSLINYLINQIEKKTKDKYPSFNKNLNPHLFRHSRLTELASNRKLNEPQLRKFAGWSKSSDMPSIYFHLDDSSIRNEIISQATDKKPKKTKDNRFEGIRCPNCSELNNKFNSFCWKCGKIISKELVAKKYQERQEIEKLKKDVEKLKKVFRDLM